MPDPIDATHAALKGLDDTQLEAFDTEYVNDARWQLYRAHLDRCFPSGDFIFLDVGGGNGVFADRVLRDYPQAHGVVLDNSPLLLGRNSAHPRKRLLEMSAADLDGMRDRFDLISFNWVLHHLVGTTRRASLDNATGALASAQRLLTPRGRIAIFENFYEGWLHDDWPGAAIFALTASRALAPLTRALGANTAGFGVSFRSRRGWLQTIERANLVAEDVVADTPWPIPWTWRFGLGVRQAGMGLLWCNPRRAT